MNSSFNLKVMTPESISIDLHVISLLVPTESGFLGIQNNHVDFISFLNAGLVSFKKEDKQWDHILIGTGYISVSNQESLLLVDEVVPLDKIDVKNIQEELQILQTVIGERAPSMSDLPSQNRVGRLNNILTALRLIEIRQQSLGN